MPVSGTYTWDETENDLTIRIPFQGKPLRLTDVTISDTLIKISHPPFLWDLVLFEPVDEDDCRAILENNILTICLRKATRKLWGRLEFQGSKQETLDRRKKSLSKHEARCKHRYETAATTKVSEQRSTLRNQMNIERTEMLRIDDNKCAEKKKAEDDLYNTLSKLQDTRSLSRSDIQCSDYECGQQVRLHQKEASQWQVNRFSEGENKACHPSLLPLRTRVSIEFTHTPRPFQTPMRESTTRQEEEYVSKNRQKLTDNSIFRKNSETFSNNCPHFYKGKGDTCYQNGDYFSAINAYSASLEQDTNMIYALVCRSASYLLIGEPFRCIDDCKRALTILECKTSLLTWDEEKQLRREILIRMACAYCQPSDMNNIEIGLAYLKDELCGKDEMLEGLKQDMSLLKMAYDVKLLGDNALRNGDYQLAIERYQKALSYHSSLLTAAANSAIASFSLERYEDCVKYCTMILNMLSTDSGGDTIRTAYIPPTGSEYRKKLVSTTLIRRADALHNLSRYDEAMEDIKFASSALENDDAEYASRLKGDIISLREKIACKSYSCSQERD